MVSTGSAFVRWAWIDTFTVMNFCFYIYLLFIVSWFLHLSARFSFLGSMRIDLLLIVVMALTILFGNKNENVTREIKLSKTHKIISILLVYIVVTLPFVQWPGSVIHSGIVDFIKAIVFYYFTVFFVTDLKKFKLFVTVFLAAQTFRIIEPVYLHLTVGYWGSFASMQGWETMDRLSGAPSDVVNSNGLAFIVLTVFPFYYFLSGISVKCKIITFILIPLSIYALILSASRSGMLGLFVILAGIFLKSKRKLTLVLFICIGILMSIQYMGDNFKDRYSSIFMSDKKNSGTAEGRISGVSRDLMVALRKPFFGHGIGTSREVNANFANNDQPSHNLYTECTQELGFVGLAIFILLIKSIIVNYRTSFKIIKNKALDNDVFLSLIYDSMQVWLCMNILFSFFSYGLTSYEWYLFAGMSVTLSMIIKDIANFDEHI